MAGVKGRSGGARPNSGGKRAGAGRKPKAAATKSANGASGGDVQVTLEPQPQGGALMNWCVGNAKVDDKGNAVSITKQVSSSSCPHAQHPKN